MARRAGDLLEARVAAQQIVRHGDRLAFQQCPQLQRVDRPLSPVLVVREDVDVLGLSADRVEPGDPLAQLVLAVKVVVALVGGDVVGEPFGGDCGANNPCFYGTKISDSDKWFISYYPYGACNLQ